MYITSAKFVALGSAVLGFVTICIKFRKVMNIMYKLLQGVLLKTFKGVHELDKLGPIDRDQMVRLRHDESILLIDDLDSVSISQTLKERFGFCNITPVDRFPSDDLIQKNHIIVTDVRIDSEGSKLNGLRFAGNLKRRYPNKQVIIISGQLRTNAYAADRLFLSAVYGYYDKNKDSVEKLSDLLNGCIVELNHPANVWRNLRLQMLNPSIGGMSDKALADVMRLEDIYVRKCLDVFKENGIQRTEWKDILIKSLQVTKVMTDVIGNLERMWT